MFLPYSIGRRSCDFDENENGDAICCNWLWRLMGYNFCCMIASDTQFDSGGAAMRFPPLDSSEDFMRRGGLRFSLSLIVSEL